MTPAGRLRTPIVILAENRIENDEGELVTSEWQPWQRTNAEVWPLTSNQIVAARQAQREDTHRVTLRYMAGLTDNHRIELPDGSILRITGLIDVGYRHIEHVATCVTGGTSCG